MRKEFWYDVPSEDFSGINGALPFGNGRMGVQIEDNVVFERLTLNESTVWSGGPYNNNAKGAFKKLEELRKSAFAGERRDFEWGYEFVQKWGGQILEPVGDWMIYLDNLRGTSDYRKGIDLEHGVLTTRFRRVEDAVTKQYFANYPSNVVCVRYLCEGGTLNLMTEITAKTSGSLAVIAPDTMMFSGAASGARGVEGKIRYTAAVKVRTDGTLLEKGGRIVVENATVCDFFLRIVSNFVSVSDLSRDHASEALAGVTSAAERGFDALLEEHTADFSELFNRITLELDSDTPDLPVNELTKRFSERFDPAFVELWFHYNRYLILSSTRNGSEPPALQGIWNERVSPPWDCKYTVNINLEMNYWSLNALNLPELNESLLDKMLALMENGKIAAREIYDIQRGDSWVLHHNTDLWNPCGAIDGCWGLTPVCGAWLTNELFFRYEYTLDRDYLRRLWPLVKGSVEFFLEFLVPYGDFLVTCPSTSPERTNGELGYVTFGSVHDVQILRELFENFLTAQSVLSETADETKGLAGNATIHFAGDEAEKLAGEVRAALEKFPPSAAVGRWGQLKEFCFHDFDFPEDSHRHLAHMYGFFPGASVYREHNPEWNAALKKSLDCRSRPGDWTGWGIAWRIALYARLGESARVEDMLRVFLDRRNGLMLSNGFGALPYEDGSAFQYDCNAAFPAVLLEAFAGSENGRVTLLPALPDSLGNGKLRGVRLRGAFLLEELEFQNGTVVSCRIRSERGGLLRIVVNGAERCVDTKPGEVYRIQ